MAKKKIYYTVEVELTDIDGYAEESGFKDINAYIVCPDSLELINVHSATVGLDVISEVHLTEHFEAKGQTDFQLVLI